jgi:6-pyruvoyltetrahydropterin/6-carboxytetrahydropterin synthase
MAHALMGYHGLCKNIHGHTYRLRVTLLGKILSDYSSAEDGLVIDFSVIKEIVKKNIVDIFDHSLVLRKDSPINDSFDLSQFYQRVIYTDFQPSCENLMMEFKRRMDPLMPDGVKLAAIRLEETPTSFSEWLLSDN